MILLKQITSKAYQNLSITTDEGFTFNFILKFLPTQNCWVCDIKYNDFEATNLFLNLNLNCIRRFKKLLPFGIMCLTDFRGDPQNIDDFSSGRAKLYILSAAEVLEQEKMYFNDEN